MYGLKVNCPRCNAFQRFGSKKREITHGIFQIYIECSFCHWEKVIIEGTSGMITLYKKIERLTVHAEHDPKFKGALEFYRELLLDQERTYKETV